jgi:hypothetical protein
MKMWRVLVATAIVLGVIGACGGGGNGPTPAPSLYGRAASR